MVFFIISCMAMRTGQVEAKTENYKIGVAVALSGPTSELGRSVVQGLKLFVEQYAEKGGFEVAGKRYMPELIINDTGGSPANGVAQAEKLVNKDHVKILFGCTSSAVAVPMLATTQPAKVIQISNSTAWEKHLGRPGNDYMIKLIASQTDTARSYIPAVVKKWNIKSAVQILPNDDAGRIYEVTYKNAAERNGVKILETFFYDPKLQDFYPILTKIKSMAPEAIWIGYWNNAMAIIVRQGRELGMKTTYIGLGTGITGEGGNLPNGERVEGFTFVSQFNPESKNPGQLDLIKRYEKTFKTKITSDFNYLLWYNNCAHMLVEAMQKAGSVTDTSKIMNFILGKTYDGPYGYPWQFDKTGLNHYGYYMGEIKKGQDVFTFVPLVTGTGN
jgi:branched-chain amino acid transport system substrate-binding protein